jgi:heterodisulfide reductase subunit D
MIIVECAEGYRMWKFDYPKLVEGCNFEVKHLSEYLVESGLIDKIPLESPSKIKVTYHDPCRLGRLGGGVYAPPRNVLKRIKNVELVEMENIQSEAQCCGVSCFRACNGITRRLREVRIQEATKTGAEYLVTTCPKCMTHFKCVLTETDDQGKPLTQKSPIKIIDFAALIGKSIH